MIKTDQCVIRPYTTEDIESSSHHANNASIARWLRNGFPHPYTVDDARKWIDSVLNSSPMYDYVIAVSDGTDTDQAKTTAIGGIGLKTRSDVNHRTMEIGYWLGEEYWGRGIATGVVKAFSTWTFETFPQIVRLEAEVYEGNEGSARVLTKAGYKLEGRMRKAVEKGGKIMDLLIFGLLREDLKNEE
ncbi:hypothetical protein ASPZODRAFT_132324 [Penicilliopsis zonata CBS 506.65]|uniref:N-acetyltransferase domain-containing protein n=1 Tax=Penicilliopsis zonata CBS 506.65 TaxID=1073090 RepID=A0A1L9SJF3_9EURO|nr:hypothetical protein ASPZODRAFT_132324 [Penicilliopsis zonata CBS 506.65]OJJ47328.1 hypothetical protein ASPZODRAFT_132324 [Penicilliopsis zonata CBS 506.65]